MTFLGDKCHRHFSRSNYYQTQLIFLVKTLIKNGICDFTNAVLIRKTLISVGDRPRDIFK